MKIVLLFLSLGLGVCAQGLNTGGFKITLPLAPPVVIVVSQPGLQFPSDLGKVQAIDYARIQQIRIQQEQLRLTQQEQANRDALAAMQLAQMRAVLQQQQAEAERQRQTALAEQRAKELQEYAAQAEIRARAQAQAEQAETQRVQAYAAQVKWDREFEASRVQASSLYDFVANLDVPAHRRMVEINSQWEVTGNPMFKSPNRPMLIAEQVAKEMGIQPKR